MRGWRPGEWINAGVVALRADPARPGHLRGAGVAVSSVSVQKPSLDEVFLAITGQPTESETTDTTSEEVR